MPSCWSDGPRRDDGDADESGVSRRSCLAGLAAGLASVTLAGCAGRSSSGDGVDTRNGPVRFGVSPTANWATARADLRRTGHAAAVGPRSNPTVERTISVPGDLRGPPVVADGVVYVATYGYAAAYDLQTGTERWRRPVPPGDDTGSPLLVGRTLVLPGRRLSAANVDYEGTLRWIGDQVEAVTSPVAAGNTVAVGTRNGTVAGIDFATGEARWAFPLSGVEAPPATDGDRFYVADRRGRCHALDPADGTAVWSQQLPGQVANAPVVAGDRVLVGDADGNLTALDANSGEREWSRQLADDGTTVYPPAVRDFAYAPDGDGGLHAVDRTGQVRWSAAGSLAAWTNSGGFSDGATLAGDTLYLHGSDGLTALAADRDGGPLRDRERWTVFGDRFRSAPVVAGERAVVVTGRDELTVFRPQ